VPIAETFDSSLTTQTYNIEEWNNWAVSKKPPPKVFLGALGGESAATSKEAGYMSADKLGPVIAYSKEFASFGGMMFWDASQVYAPAQEGFIGSIKDELKATASGSAGATSAAATSAGASAK
jgi:chitinase